MKLRILFAGCIMLAFASSSMARFMRPDLEKIPVERLVKNLEKKAADEPKNAEHLLNLARAHAMAFAKKSDEIEVNKKAPDAPWLGFTPPLVPFGKTVQATDDKEKAKAAAHLEKAIAAYESALKLAPESPHASLGLAWVTQQAGKKEEAVKQYRKLIEDAWEKKEKDLNRLGLSGETITTEAGGYLLPLLDPTKDEKEIETLKERIAKLKKLPRPVTPIAIPLKAGLSAQDIEDRDAAVAFDADGSGEKRQWSWIKPNAAWLVYDAKGKGEIGGALQLFGNVTFRMFHSNGYGALATLDDNGDGELRGAELTGLALWHDRNSNGIADPGEVRSLADHGVIGLSCKWDTLERHPDRIAFNMQGVRYADGTTRASYDLILQGK